MTELQTTAMRTITRGIKNLEFYGLLNQELPRQQKGLSQGENELGPPIVTRRVVLVWVHDGPNLNMGRSSFYFLKLKRM